jgi:hypothetical protein
MACDAPATEPPLTTTPSESRGLHQIAATAGGGHYLLSGVADVQFSFLALQLGNGKAGGAFQIRFSDSGFFYDIAGKVTCVTSDPVAGRAWIGGIVLRNRSTDPALQTAIHQPGRDVWFRVLDVGSTPGAVDRTSFYGFEGAAGIITSEQYCAARIWPDDNARTWPVTSGGILVQ